MATSVQNIDPIARELLEAVESERIGELKPQEPLSKTQARRVATRVGRGMLAAATQETAEHSDDVVVISRAICDLLEIKGADRQDLLAAARLHDIGKVAVPSEIIHKPGKLTGAEWDLMRTHTVVGDQILGAVPELKGIAALVRSSHERWDGAGYPDGLAGDEIPLGSRVIFCADAFHAIRSDRPYRKGVSAAEALAEVGRNAGTQFDPMVVEALRSVTRELQLAPAGGKVRRTSRLTALLMMLALGMGGSAAAKSGVLDGSEPAGSATPMAPAPLVCDALDCPPLLGVSLTDQLGVGQPGARGSEKGSAGNDAPGSPRSDAQGSEPGSGSPGATSPQGASEAPGGGAPGGAGGGSAEGGSSGGAPGGSSGGADANLDHPHGGPPGQTGDHPQGGPPGQTGDHPQGGPPGQTGGNPNGGPPGQTGSHPQGGPPGQNKK